MLTSQNNSSLIKGVLFLTLGSFLFSLMASGVRYLGEGVPTFQIIFVRYWMNVVLVLPMLLFWIKPKKWIPEKFSWHFWRGVSSLATMACVYYALRHIELANMTTLIFARNFFVLALAAAVLGEVVHHRRIIATLIGFIGVVISLRPDQLGLHPALFLAVLAPMFLGVTTLLVKKLTWHGHNIEILFYYSVVAGLLVTPLAIWTWQDISFDQWVVVFGLSFISVIAQFCFVHAYRLAEASALAPFDYLQYVYAIGMGYVFFGEMVDILDFTGAALVIGGTGYLLWREKKKKNE